MSISFDGKHFLVRFPKKIAALISNLRRWKVRFSYENLVITIKLVKEGE